MKRFRERSWVMVVGAVLALLLGVVPLPDVVQPMRPFWLALLVTYLVLEQPERFNVGRAFLLGLVADMVHGSLLGEQALRLVLLTALLQHLRARLRFFPPTQQALVLGAMLVGDRAVVALLHLAVGQPLPTLTSLWSVLITLLLWPLMFVLLDRLIQGRRLR